jgi:hypothetical protein
MIRRRRDDRFLLIAQHDHALLAGELARRVGNGVFAAPFPFEPVVMAVAQHDCGWPAQDAQPARNPQNFPAHALESPPDIAMAAWAASVEKVAAADHYAGLLVSLHVMALAAHAVHVRPDPIPDAERHCVFKFNRFIHAQIELQEQWRQQLGMRIDLPLHGGVAETGRSPDEDLLAANFRLLQALDQLSLILCFDALRFERLGPVNPRPGDAPQILHVDRLDECDLLISPWPFDAPRIETQIAARSIPARPYATDADLCAALAAAPTESLPLRLRS